MARKLARAAKDIDDGNKKIKGVKSNAQKLAEAKESRDAIREDIERAKEKLNQVQGNSDRATRETEIIRTEMAQELAKTRVLKEEIARLEEDA